MKENEVFFNKINSVKKLFHQDSIQIRQINLLISVLRNKYHNLSYCRLFFTYDKQILQDQSNKNFSFNVLCFREMSHASTFDNLFNKYYNTYLLKSIKKNRGNNILFFKEKFKVEFKVVIHDASKNNDWGNSYLNLIGDRVILYQNNNNLVYHDFKSSNILDCYTKLEFNTDKNKICLNFKYKKKNKSTNDILICPIRKNVVDYQFMTNKISNLCTQNIDHFLKEIFYNKLNSCDFFSKLKGHSQEFLLKESYNFIKHKVELLSEKRERKLRNNLISFFKTMCKGILNNYLDNFKEDTKLLKIVSNLIHAKPCECKEDNKKNETKSQDPYTKRKKCFKKRDENLNIGYRGCNITKSLTISDKSKNKSKENINVTKTHNGDNYISYQNESINPNKLTGNSSKIKIKINQTRHVNCYNKNNIEIHKNQSDTQKNLVRSSQIIDLNNTERLRINNKSANLNEESIILYKLYQHYFFNKNGIPSQLLLNSNIQPNKNMRLNVANLTINLIKESSSLFKAPSQFRTFNRLDNKPSIKIDQDCNRNDIYCLCKSHPQYKNCVCLAYPKSVVCLKNYCIYHDSDYECSPLICDKPNIEKTDKCYCKHNIEDLRCKCKTNPFSQDCFCLQFPLSHLCNKRSCHFNPYSIFCSCRTSKGEGLCSGRYCINHPNDAYCNCITNPITGSCKCLNDPRSCSSIIRL